MQASKSERVRLKIKYSYDLTIPMHRNKVKWLVSCQGCLCPVIGVVSWGSASSPCTCLSSQLINPKAPKSLSVEAVVSGLFVIEQAPRKLSVRAGAISERCKVELLRGCRCEFQLTRQCSGLTDRTNSDLLERAGDALDALPTIVKRGNGLLEFSEKYLPTITAGIKTVLAAWGIAL